MSTTIAIDLRKTCIIGAGGLGKCALHVAFCVRSRVTVLDDKVHGIWVSGTLDMLNDKRFVEEYKFVVAIGDNKIRYEIVQRVLDVKGQFDTLIHPGSVVKREYVGVGSIVLPGVILGPDATVGKHCILGNAVSVAHDCVIGDFVNVCDGTVLGGHVRVADAAFIGLNVTVLPKIMIGTCSLVGAGAVVTNGVPSYVTVVGNPARPK